MRFNNSYPEEDSARAKRRHDSYNVPVRIDRKAYSFISAFLIVQLAIEELGKAAILREEYEKSGDDFILVDTAVFGRDGGKGHKLKASKAWEMLDPSWKILHKGGFEKGFSEYGFDVDTEASHHTRLKCAYVDYVEEEQLWWVGGTLDDSKVLALIDTIEKALQKL